VRWTRPALADLIEAQEYIATENPDAAHAVARHVWDAARYLQDNPETGRTGHVPGTREWVVNHTPYLIVYRIAGDFVEILRLWHAKRNWKA
jgi:addiction module RelE/StbE family toxin